MKNIEINSSAQPLTLGDLDQIGGILEPASQILAAQNQAFYEGLAITVAVLSLFVSITAYFVVVRPFFKKIDKIEQDIENEVKKQIVFIAHEKLESAREFALTKINYEVEKIREKSYLILFSYQNLVYLVNQNIKQQSDKILANDSLSDKEKMIKITNLQYRYNEIVNNDLPKLFSGDINIVKAVVKQLSEYKDVKSIILMHLQDMLVNGHFSPTDKENIKILLKSHYNFNGDI